MPSVAELIGVQLIQLQKNLECPICFDLFVDPRTSKCSHNFCMACVAQCLKNKEECPCCKAPMTRRSLSANPHLRELVDAYRHLDECIRLDSSGKVASFRRSIVPSQASQQPMPMPPTPPTPPSKALKEMGHVLPATVSDVTATAINTAACLQSAKRKRVNRGDASEDHVHASAIDKAPDGEDHSDSDMSIALCDRASPPAKRRHAGMDTCSTPQAAKMGGMLSVHVDDGMRTAKVTLMVKTHENVGGFPAAVAPLKAKGPAADRAREGVDAKADKENDDGLHMVHANDCSDDDSDIMEASLFKRPGRVWCANAPAAQCEQQRSDKSTKAAPQSPGVRAVRIANDAKPLRTQLPPALAANGQVDHIVRVKGRRQEAKQPETVHVERLSVALPRPARDAASPWPAEVVQRIRTNEAKITSIDAIIAAQKCATNPAQIPLWVSAAAEKSARPRVALATTGLDDRQMAQLNEAALRMGAVVVGDLSQHATHLIATVDSHGFARRTLKYFNAILLGKWIVTFEWITASANAGRFLPEEPYEIHSSIGSGRGVPSRARTARASGHGGLFSGVTFSFDGSHTTPTTEQLTELIRNGGGRMIGDKAAMHAEAGASATPRLVCLFPRDCQPSAQTLRKVREGWTLLNAWWVMDCAAEFMLLPEVDYAAG